MFDLNDLNGDFRTPTWSSSLTSKYQGPVSAAVCLRSTESFIVQLEDQALHKKACNANSLGALFCLCFVDFDHVVSNIRFVSFYSF